MNGGAFAFSVLAILAGVLFPMQTAVNTRLSAVVGGPFLAGLVALIIMAALTTRHFPSVDSLKQYPPWLFVGGGLLGATYLGLNVFLVPRVGSAAMMALAVAGQMLGALTVDATGLFGLAIRDLSPGRIFGTILVVFGAALVRLS